ncbi:iron-containing alcohol dehydrogenase [Alkalihalobacillus sp. LMS39]|uniref:iron-containing alcohol dehydrogenase n=1 Tax=Alkalihalobacillus sp. LMS39 TaxID=2924032 RepID=UPI001FB20D6C|nr:iron-containing alcohol dehydrogenase [Alkalihalobacillus sp. LMS39]UOE95418.1 iron-containing alcohol dehydrogenase [Alkalihalobacillus sp. LMS39]
MNSQLRFPLKSYVGQGTKEKLLQEVKQWKIQSILVITDQTIVSIGICDHVLQPLFDNYHIDIYTDIMPEPTLACAEKVVAYAKQKQYELVIGIGGGSALDIAKLTAVLMKQEGDVHEYLNLTGTKSIVNQGVPKIMIPTTAGTGSEVTDIAVLSLKATKDVITHPYLLSDVAIVDSTLTESVPPRITAATGIDALTHAIEAYLSVHANPVTDSIALGAIKLIGESIATAVENGCDSIAREKMSTASYMAGLAFYNAGVAGVHALAYPLGNQFKIPHGESNAVLLPFVMNELQQGCTEKLANVVKTLAPDVDDSKSKEELATDCVNTLHHLVQGLQLPSSLQYYDMKKESLVSLTEEALKQTRLLSRSPVELDEETIYRIYEAAFHGEIT